MTHDMGKIDQAFADKFFHDEYVELKNDIKISLDKSDEVFLEGATVVLQKLSAFIGKLNNRIAEYHQQKADADDMANNAKELLKRGFITPEDYLQEGLDGEKTALFEYLDKYIPNDNSDILTTILLILFDVLLRFRLMIKINKSTALDHCALRFSRRASACLPPACAPKKNGRTL